MLYLTVADLTRLHGWTREEIYALARKHKWHRTRTRPVGYWADQVAEYVEQNTQSDTQDQPA